jgi:hypothetical protein
MPGIPVVTGLNSSQAIWTNFSTAGGNFLVVTTNGGDPVKNYDGTNWTNAAITGVDPTTLVYVFNYQSRLFYLQKNSSVVFYLPPSSISGAALTVNVGPELLFGGPIVAGSSFTYQGVTGPQDYVAFISSEGEVVIYSGTDPSSSTTWGLVGTARVGRPIGNRCLLKIGGDLAVLTEDGMISLTRSLLLDRTAEQQAAFTDNIRIAFANQYALSGSLFGWQPITWPMAHMVIVNVPTVASTTSNQYVMNVLTGAWCRFLNINALCWVVSQDNIFFGDSSGNIMQFGKAGSDAGNDINATAVGGFSDMGKPGVIKHIKAAMAFAQATSVYQIGVNIATDFAIPNTAASSASFGSAQSFSGPLWDSALWDQVTWGSGAVTTTIANEAWLGVAAQGYYLAPVIFTQSNAITPNQVQFISSTMIYETGAPLG